MWTESDYAEKLPNNKGSDWFISIDGPLVAQLTAQDKAMINAKVRPLRASISHSMHLTLYWASNEAEQNLSGDSDLR